MKIVIVVSVLVFSSGCALQRPALFPEKQSKEEFVLMGTKEVKEKQKFKIVLDPQEAKATDKGIEITIRYVTPGYLKNFFKRADIFGRPKKNPYPPEVIVFSVKVANNSGGRIKVEPLEFVMVDDLNSQHSSLSPEYIAALYNKGTISMFAETGAEYAPGLYSAPFGVAQTIAGSSLRRRLSLLREVSLSGGYVYDGVVYEGYVSFFKPNPKAKTLNLILPNIQTRFDAQGNATETVDFQFIFNIRYEK